MRDRTTFIASQTPMAGARALLTVMLVLWAAGALLILRNGAVANAVQNRDVATVRRLAGADDAALRLLAEDEFVRRQLPAARRDALASLARAPLDRRALRTLGITEEASGDPDRATAIMNRAGQVSWRDVSAQLWLLRQALAGGDHVAVAQRADALLRTEHYAPAVFAVLRQAVVDQDMRGALAQQLADRPPWRRAFLGSLGVPRPQVGSANVALLDTLRATPAPPSEAESASLLNALISAGYGQTAAALSARLFPPQPDGGRGNLLDDVDFSRSAALLQEVNQRSPFRWQALAQSNVSAVVGTAPDGRPALEVQDTGGGAENVVFRAVALPPGRYRLSFAATTPEGGPVTRIVPRVNCWATHSQLALPRPYATVGREAVTDLDFVVTADCDVQRVNFAVAAVEPPVGSTFFLRHLRIDRLGPGS